MLKKIGLGLAAVLAILVIVIATRPDAFSVQRSATINAPAERIYPHIADFHQWAEWSPWAKLDPKMVTTFSGAPAGVGAVYEWTGNDDVGKGKMAIIDVKEPQKIAIKLDFLEPFAASNDTSFELQPTAAGTTVTWRMSGKNDFMGKAFSLFMDMDGMIGKDFEKGLASLKGIVEK